MLAYYVTVIRGKRVGWLYGPLPSKSSAETMVAPVRKLASAIDPWTDFDAFGVTKLEGSVLRQGVLNTKLTTP